MPKLPMLDFQKALTSCKGDQELAERLLKKFHAALPTERNAFLTAAAHGDWKELDRLLHRLQSGASYLGLEQMNAVI